LIGGEPLAPDIETIRRTNTSETGLASFGNKGGAEIYEEDGTKKKKHNWGRKVGRTFAKGGFVRVLDREEGGIVRKGVNWSTSERQNESQKSRKRRTKVQAEERRQPERGKYGGW